MSSEVHIGWLAKLKSYGSMLPIGYMITKCPNRALISNNINERRITFKASIQYWCTKKYQCSTHLFNTVYGPIAVAVWIQSNTYILPIIVWIKSRIRHVYCLALVIPFLYQGIYLDLSNEANTNCHLIINRSPNNLIKKFQAM